MNKEKCFNLLVLLLQYCSERYKFEDIYENISLDELIEQLIQDYLR